MAMRGRIAELIELATSSIDRQVDDRHLKAIKAVVRSSDDNVRVAAQLLMDRLGTKHSQVRYLSLLVVDELFTRSKLFRNLLMERLEDLLQLTLGYGANRPLPPPSDRAAMLKSKGLEIVEKWNAMFGPHYKQLRLGYNYLKNTLRLKFPGIQEAASRAEEERQLREQRTQELLRCRFVQLADNFGELKKDIESTMSQLDECFLILSERNREEDDCEFGGGGDEAEEFGVRSLRLTRDQEEPSFQESQDNSAIFDMVRDLFKLVVTRHTPATQEWLNLLMRVDPDDRGRRDSVLKEVIDIRNSLFSAKKKCEELGIELVDKERDDDIEWEEEEVVRHEISEARSVSTSAATAPAEASSSGNAIRVSRGEKESSDPRGDASRQKLLQDAPVLPWGSFLDAWGSEAGVYANSRGMAVDNHWGRVDPDALIPTEKLAEMQVRASYYEPPKKDIPTCLAPLRKGGLCQRRDLRSCPLHGPIISRDERGNPVREAEAGERGKAAAEPPAATLATIAAQAVKNIREADEAEKRKRRSQRLKDREHNDSVLRSASAISSVDLLRAEGTSAQPLKKRRGGDLNEMLRKKPTAKDRIARRLLSDRANDGAVAQWSREEDMKYREAFPSQW